MEFTCECCHYTTTVKCNFTKHISSKKHIIQKYKQTPAFKLAVSNAPLAEVAIQNKPEIAEVAVSNEPLAEVSPKVIFCKHCNKSFSFKQSMYRHIKTVCTGNKDETLNELQLMALKMENERKAFEFERTELLKQLDKQQKLFDKQSEIQSKHIEYLTCILEMHRRN